ncbi:hypothetical protein Tco_0848122 [Tanacetum coccineum]
MNMVLPRIFGFSILGLSLRVSILLWDTTWKVIKYCLGPNGLIRVKKKVGQASQDCYKAWSKEANKRSNDRKINIQQNLSEVDKLIDQGKSNDEILIKRKRILMILQELNNRTPWRFLKKLKFDGPLKVMKTPNISMSKMNFLLISRSNFRLSKLLASALTSLFQLALLQIKFKIGSVLFTYEESKRLIGICAPTKHLARLDFLEFYRKYWTTIDDDVFQAVRDFFVNGRFPRGCNSSFIALIPKIQDSKFMKDFIL